jgi:outer membrane lipoprotein-sorting protein
MISGVKKTPLDRTRRALVLLACAGSALPALAFDLDALMAMLARQSGGEATFIEQRFVRGLDQPLRSNGTLAFTAPDRLSHRTLEPRADAMVVEGNTVTLTRNGRSRTLAIDSTPELLGLIEALRATLSGNGVLLQRYFQASLAGSAGNWSLELTPRDTRLAEQLQNLSITGREGVVRGMEMDFRNGDRTVTVITPAAARP